MSDPLYRRELLRLAADAHGAGRLAAFDASAEIFNPACGDKVTIDLLLAGGRIVEVALETKACVLVQASASILGRTLKGAGRGDVEQLHARVAAMLASEGQPPSAPFDGYAAFVGAVEYRSRHACVLLPIEAVLSALMNSHPVRDENSK